MKKFRNKTYFVILFIGLNSCFSKKFEYIGEKQVINKEDWKVKFYQLDEFEMFTPVRYKVVNSNGSLITEKQALTGADANLQNVEKFYAKVQDSIFFICYPYPKVVAIKNILNLNKPNQWELIKKLNDQDSSLYSSRSKIKQEE
jgi:hypothetical protein